MRNKFAGTCYRCNEHVGPGEGHFERFRGGWRTQHAACAIKFRGLQTPTGKKTDSAGSTDWPLALGAPPNVRARSYAMRPPPSLQPQTPKETDDERL